MSESNNKIQGIMDTTMEKIRQMSDADTIIGEQITIGNVTVIPVSKVSYGFASGGSDFAMKSAQQPLFGGGGGAGMSISPVAFVVIKGDDVKVMPVTCASNSADKAIILVPEMFDKITGLFKKNKPQTSGKNNDKAEMTAEPENTKNVDVMNKMAPDEELQ